MVRSPNGNYGRRRRGEGDLESCNVAEEGGRRVATSWAKGDGVAQGAGQEGGMWIRDLKAQIQESCVMSEAAEVGDLMN